MATSALTDLERRRDRFDPASARLKLKRLRELKRTRLARADQVRRLHEVLCFMRAYPDNADVLGAVEAMLARFDRRADLRAHRAALAYSGIAGTTIWFPLLLPTALWLAQRWPDPARAGARRHRSRRLDRAPCCRPADAGRGARAARVEAAGLRGARRGAWRRETDADLPRPARRRDAGRRAHARGVLRRHQSELACCCRDRTRRARTRAALPRRATGVAAGTAARASGPICAGDDAPAALGAPATSADAEAMIDARARSDGHARRDLDAFAFANARDAWLDRRRRRPGLRADRHAAASAAPSCRRSTAA